MPRQNHLKSIRANYCQNSFTSSYPSPTLSCPDIISPDRYVYITPRTALIVPILSLTKPTRTDVKQHHQNWLLFSSASGLLALTILVTDIDYAKPIVLTWLLISYSVLIILCKPEKSPADLAPISRVILSALAFAWPAGGTIILYLFILAAITHAIDVWLARRHHPTEYGAVLDREADQLLIFCLAAVLSTTSTLGITLVVLPAIKYTFTLAQAGLRLTYADPKAMHDDNSRAKTIYVFSLLGLIINLVPGLPQALGEIILMMVTLLISSSFFLDFVWLVRNRKSGIKS